jgi:tetratricopeptide (TPR) repeat protein
MVWYQTTPYFAYFYTGRYTDVLNLASNTLNAVEEPSLEESWYWRAQAKNALGDVEGAIADLRESLTWHPNFAPSLGLLEQWGAAP